MACAQRVTGVWAAALLAGPVLAQTPYAGPLFDAHLHYNDDACVHAQPDPAGHLRTCHPARLRHPKSATRQARRDITQDVLGR